MANLHFTPLPFPDFVTANFSCERYWREEDILGSRFVQPQLCDDALAAPDFDHCSAQELKSGAYLASLIIAMARNLAGAYLGSISIEIGEGVS
jgi:hypothetical protein